MHQLPKPSGRRVRSPWLWVVAGTLVAAVIGTSTMHFVTASCAGEIHLAGPGQAPPLSTVIRGQAYFYNPGAGPGACSLGPLPASGLYVSLAEPQFVRGAACGSYVNVSGPSGTVTAEVVDSCPGCTNGALDMSEAAFARIANPAQGTAPVSYVQAQNPRLPGPLTVRVERSSSANWLGLQILNTGNPLALVEVAPSSAAPGTGWQALTLSPGDYWISSAGPGPGPFRVRITDVFGHQVIVRNIHLRPGTRQRTRLLMYTATAGDGQPYGPTTGAAPASTPAKTPSADTHRSYPSRSASPGTGC